MRHVENALLKFREAHKSDVASNFISIDNIEDVPGIVPVVNFTIQSDPVSLVGVNGVQATDMLEYTKYLFESLNEAFPCPDNALTLFHIEAALKYQAQRTADRQKRNVEGKNEA